MDGRRAGNIDLTLMVFYIESPGKKLKSELARKPA
jgi:hypothetical protein